MRPVLRGGVLAPDKGRNAVWSLVLVVVARRLLVVVPVGCETYRRPCEPPIFNDLSRRPCDTIVAEGNFRAVLLRSLMRGASASVDWGTRERRRAHRRVVVVVVPVGRLVAGRWSPGVGLMHYIFICTS